MEPTLSGEMLVGACPILLPPLLGLLVASSRWLRVEPQVLTAIVYGVAFLAVGSYLLASGLAPYTRWPFVVLLYLAPYLTIVALLRSPIGEWGRVVLLFFVPAAGYVGLGIALSLGAWLGWLEL